MAQKINLEMEPVEIRGHHLRDLCTVFTQDFEEYSDLLLAGGYISLDEFRKGEGFAKEVYEKTKALFENPNQKFLIVADSPDFVCSFCKKDREKEGCFRNRNPERIVGPFFSGYVESDDVRTALEYGLRIGRVYTSSEIRKRVGF